VISKHRKKLLWFFFISAILFSWIFNLRSNVHLLFSAKGDLYNIEKIHLVDIVENDIYKLSKLNLWRRNAGFIKRVVNKASRPALYFLEVKNNNGFKVALNENGTTSTKLIGDINGFAINSSFYEHDFGIRGEVIVDGKRRGKASNSSGYFKVINGKAVAGPKSLFQNIQGKVDFSCQAHPSVMKNGRIWEYIISESKNKDYWQQKTYRSLVGTKSNGNLCFLISSNGGLVSIKEMSLIAKQQGIKTATMLDAGAALQYSILIDSKSYSFSSWNNKLNLGRLMDKLIRRIIGQRFYSSSPVFITR